MNNKKRLSIIIFLVKRYEIGVGCVLPCTNKENFAMLSEDKGITGQNE